MSEFGCGSMAGSGTNSPLHTHLILVCQEQKLVKGHMTKLLLMMLWTAPPPASRCHTVVAVEAITIERSHPCKRLQQLV